MQVTDLGHGRGWLDAPAAASIARIDARLGRPVQITDAGRTYDEQMEDWQAWQDGHGAPAYHPDRPSPHQTGEAIDSNESLTLADVFDEHGFILTIFDDDGDLAEWWHREYRADRDQHRNDPTPTTQEDTDMSMNTFRHPNGTIFFIDEMGADHLGDYKTADIGLGEFIQTAADAFGAPVQVNERQFDITVAIANRRWEAKKNEIIAGVVKALRE